MKCISLIACASAFLLVAPTAGFGRTPQPPLPPGVTSCAFDALAHDPDPNGLNIREAPNAQSRVLGRLPDVDTSEGRMAAEFHVIGTRNGWFLIEGALYGHYAHRKTFEFSKTRPYAGRGWVSGKLISIGLRAEFLKSAPSANAPNVVRLFGPGFGYGSADYRLDAILGCSGKWFRVEMPLQQEYPNRKLTPLMRTDAPAGYIRGWTDEYCNNPFTTCV